MQGTWVRRPQGDTVVVFVHGILSSGDVGWTASSGAYWPGLLAEEEELSPIGIYVFTYKSDVFSGSYNVLDAVEALKEFGTLDGAFDAGRLIFVCHSMGGLVVRKLIVDRSNDFFLKRQLIGQVIGLFLVGSPSLGSNYADLMTPIAKLLGHTQADALRFGDNNKWLMELNEQFRNILHAGHLKIFGKELVEDTFVVLKKWVLPQIVTRFEGAVFFGEAFKVPGSDHFTISKPIRRSEIQHRLLVKFILENDAARTGAVALDGHRATIFLLRHYAENYGFVDRYAHTLYWWDTREHGLTPSSKEYESQKNAWSQASRSKVERMVALGLLSEIGSEFRITTAGSALLRDEAFIAKNRGAFDPPLQLTLGSDDR